MDLRILKLSATSVVALLALLLGGCQLSGCPSNRSEWISAMLDVQSEMSSHLLKLETDKDALNHGVIATNCNPDESKAAYKNVAAKLRTLLNEGAGLELSGTYREDIQLAIAEWAALERRQRSQWEEAKAVAEPTVGDGCMRPSDIVLTRITIEQRMNAAIKSSLR